MSTVDFQISERDALIGYGLKPKTDEWRIGLYALRLARRDYSIKTAADTLASLMHALKRVQDRGALLPKLTPLEVEVLTDRVNQQCKGTIAIEGELVQCGSNTKHPSGYCYAHRIRIP